jgi:hypothetical protein
MTQGTVSLCDPEITVAVTFIGGLDKTINA